MYSHLHPASRVYDPHPKLVGIAFGGSLGNERIFIDEDFARVTIRHHAVDKTYQHGSLIPDQVICCEFFHFDILKLIQVVDVWTRPTIVWVFIFFKSVKIKTISSGNIC